MKIHGFILFLLSPFLIGAQSIENLPVNLIDQSAGLLTTDNRFCYKDTKGFLWFSSTAGLHRFDGNQIVKYQSSGSDSTSLKGQNVNGLIFEDDEHNLWFSTTEAINCYIRKEDSFRSYSYPGRTDGVYFTCGLDRSGQLWLYYDNLLLTFDIRKHNFRIRTKLLVDAQRGLTLLNDKGDVSHVFVYSLDRSHPGFQMIEVDQKDSLRTSFHFNGGDEPAYPVRDLYIRNDSLLWMACRAGIFSFNIFTGKYDLYNPMPEVADIYINAVEGLNDSVLILTSYAKGAFIFNVPSRRFTHHYQLIHNDQIIPDHPQEIYTSPDGGVWISIPGKGIAYFHPDNLLFKSYRLTLATTIANSPIDPNTFIELADHRIWGTSNNHGGFVLNDALGVEKQYHREHTRGWQANNTIISAMDRQGRIWTLTASSPCVLNPEDKVISLSTIAPGSMYSICRSNDTSMVLGSLDGGLYRTVEDEGKDIHLERIQGVDTAAVYSFLYLHTDGRIYGSTYQSHIDIFQPGEEYKLEASIPFKADVQCMEPDFQHTDILIGTDRGMYIFSPGSHSMDSLEWFNENASLIVFGIVPTRDHFIWMSTNNGIFTLDLETKMYSHYGMENGTGSLIFNRNAYLHRANGQIWFGSNEGITVIDPRRIQLKLPAEPVRITKIFINDIEQAGIVCAETGSTNISEIVSLHLPFQQNTISIEFASISYSGINHSNYEYRLLGSEEKWVQAGNRGIVRYANIPAGQYTFEVRNTGLASIGPGTTTSLKINIIAPLVQRRWFVTVSLAFLTLLLFWIYNINERRKLKLQQLEFEKRIALETERLRIANDMHDDLGSGLSALSLRAKLLAAQAEKPELRSQLNEFVNNANHLTQQIRETIWTINSKNDTIDNLVTRLHQYALEYFRGSPVECKIDLMQERITSSIPGNHRREIYLAYKEALHNVYKHSMATQVAISMEMKDPGILRIHIRDNGSGFNPDEPSGGTGLTSMQKRMQDIGGQFEIHSDHEGTAITLIYPV